MIEGSEDDADLPEAGCDAIYRYMSGGCQPLSSIEEPRATEAAAIVPDSVGGPRRPLPAI
jgi:hypothetical protein